MYNLPNTSTLRLVQISDTHLHGPEQGQLLGINTLFSMQCVLDTVRQERAHIDTFLVSGDLSQDGTAGSYQHLQQALSTFACPAFWLNGNHDKAEVMQQVAAESAVLQQVVRSTHWQLVLLNSQVAGAVFGYLNAEQLQLLEDTLAERPDLHTLVCLHHHPLPMGSAWMDKIGLQNADALAAVIKRHRHVRAVLWGHVHQESDRTIDGVRYLSSPSTCVQFLPGSTDFALDLQAPGYRWLDLHADGSIDTGVSRVQGIVFNVDMASQGY